MKLTNPTDAELNRAFAVEVLGWNSAFVDQKGLERGTQYQGENINWCGSADAILPHLQNHYADIKYWSGCAGERPVWRIEIEGMPVTESGGIGEDKHFAKAAALALLSAHGVETEYTEP